MKRVLFVVILFFAIFWSCEPLVIDVGKESEIFYPVEEVAIVSDEDGWDLPANEGIKNALLNAEQLVNITYQPVSAFNRVGGSLEAGTMIRGLIYSSTRAEDLFVPNNVSLWSFMSALKNPHSFPYTVDVSETPFNLRGDAKPYYGQVCTSFVQYALGIKYNFQIHQMTVWEGMDKVMPQNIDKIRLGDILITEKGHTRLITGIRREKGHVVEVAISEGVSLCARREVYPVQEVLNSFENEDYAFYRYRFINDTKHVQSPFVSVGDETPVLEDVLSGMVVIPRRGDMANWRKDENVILDVVSQDDYTGYKLNKDGKVIEEKHLPSNGVLNLGVMPFGKYGLCLTNGVEESREARWIVADYSIKVRAIGSRKVRVSFSSANAKPLWVTWRIPANGLSHNNNMPLWTTVISEKDSQKGFVESELDPYIARRCGLGKWDFKVAFETEFGIISSDSESVYVY